MKINYLNNIQTNFKGKFVPHLKSNLSSQIKNELPVGKVTSVLEDANVTLVKQKDGRAEVTSRFVDGVLRETTEIIDGETYKNIYSNSGQLVKKIQRIGNMERIVTFKDGLPYSKLDILG